LSTNKQHSLSQVCECGKRLNQIFLERQNPAGDGTNVIACM